jgi:hypothetical protein
VQKVRDLAASKFLDSGFSTAQIELSATSNGGKNVEKILITKDGDHYVAKRDGELALYQLDPAVISGLQLAAQDLKPAAEPKPEPAKKK